MKTPNGIKEDWHLDNYIGKEVTVMFNGEQQPMDGILLENDSKGIYVRRKVKDSKSREVWFLHFTQFKNLSLPELPKDDKKAEEAK